MKAGWILILGVVVLFAVSCEDKSIAFNPATQFGLDTVKIDSYLQDNGIVAQTHPSGLRFVIHQQGSGDRPGPDKCVLVNYKLRLLGDTTVVEEGNDYATALTTKQVLAWRIGLKEIQKGGSITLYAPSTLGYGHLGNGVIPKDQILVFDVDLLNVTGFNTAGGYCYPWPQ